MTKKDYVLLAGLLAETRNVARKHATMTARPYVPSVDLDQFERLLIDALRQDSPRFDASRFLAAANREQ